MKTTVIVARNHLSIFFIGTCLSAKSIYFYEIVQNSLRNIFTDMGIIALALLVNDRYKGMRGPMAVKYPIRHLVAVLATVSVVTGIDLLGQALWLNGNLTLNTMLVFGFACFQIRAAYSFACLFM